MPSLSFETKLYFRLVEVKRPKHATKRQQQRRNSVAWIEITLKNWFLAPPFHWYRWHYDKCCSIFSSLGFYLTWMHKFRKDLPKRKLIFNIHRCQWWTTLSSSCTLCLSMFTSTFNIESLHPLKACAIFVAYSYPV